MEPFKMNKLDMWIFSQSNYHYRIQYSGAIIAHGGDTWIEQGGGISGGDSMTKFWKRA